MAVAKAQPKKFQTYRKNVKLGGGQTLGFTAGRGYYAKPAPVRPAPVRPTGGGGATVPPPVTYGAAPWNPGPNYGADLVGEPDFTEANANYQYNLDLATKQRQNRIRAAMIKLGFQPGSANAEALAGVDPSTAQLAAQNSASALAQLGLQRGKSRADLSAELASRGMLDTGALRGGENMVQSAYDEGLLGATQDYLNEQNTALADEATTKATGQQAFTAAKAAAAAAAARNPLFTPTDGVAEQGDTLAPGQGTRPAQTPVLARPPRLPTRPMARPPARFYTYKNQVRLKPGQTLKFQPGRGYYAG